MARNFNIIGILDATGSGFTVNAVSVTATATKLPTTNLDNRKAMIIRNFSKDNIIYIGDSAVTTTTGFPILPYESIPFDINAGANLYAICETGLTADVRTLEVDNS